MPYIVLTLLLITVTSCMETKSFLTNFSLRDTVCDLSYPGIDCSTAESGGGIGAGAGGYGGSTGGYSEEISTAETFALEPEGRESFDARQFLDRLAEEMVEQIEAAGYTAEVATTERGFVISYTADGASGRIEIEGSTHGDSFAVDCTGSERAGGRR